MIFRQMRHSPYVYHPSDLRELEAYIEKEYGEFPTVLHEIVHGDLHIDIAVIPPRPECNEYTLVTMGMGAYKMKVPRSFRTHFPKYAELVLSLPADWNMESKDPKWIWPMLFLKVLARLPKNDHTWLSDEHTVPNFENEHLAPDTALNGALILSDTDRDGQLRRFTTSKKKTIQFYRVVALYQEEMDYKLIYGAQALLQLLKENASDPDAIYRLDKNRKNVCEDFNLNP